MTHHEYFFIHPTSVLHGGERVYRMTVPVKDWDVMSSQEINALMATLSREAQWYHGSVSARAIGAFRLDFWKFEHMMEYFMAVEKEFRLPC